MRFSHRQIRLAITCGLFILSLAASASRKSHPHNIISEQFPALRAVYPLDDTTRKGEVYIRAISPEKLAKRNPKNTDAVLEGAVPCATALVSCSGNTYSFPAGTEGWAPDPIEGYPNYGCLGQMGAHYAPGPAWYYMQVGSPGDITIFMEKTGAGGNDVDFICWGPFSSLTEGCAVGLTGTCRPEDPCCNNTTPGCTYPKGNIVDCSFSGSATETCHILNAQVGEIYILLLSNWDGGEGTITFSQTGGTGVTNCSIVINCSMIAITANPSACDPGNNTYSVTGAIEFSNPPPTGTLTITDITAIPPVSQSFIPSQFASPLDYTLSGIPCDGLVHTLSASFSDSVNCNMTHTYTSPGPMCPSAILSGGGSICDDGSQTVDLVFTLTQGAPPFNLEYTVDGGTPVQVNYIAASPYTITTSAPGVYALTAVSNIACATGGSASGTATVTLNPLPALTFPSLAPICISANPLPLNTANPAGGVYSGPGVTAGIFSPSVAGAGTHTLQYVYTDANGCTDSTTQTITVNPLPVVDFPALPGQCISSPALVLTSGTPSGGSYSGPGVVAGSFSPALAGTGIHPLTYHFTDLNGCTDSASATVEVNPEGQVDDPTDQALCNGVTTLAINFTTTNTIGTTSYSWVNDNPAIGLAANGLGNIPAFPGMNPGANPVTATVTVTPHLTNNGVTCEGPAQSFTFTINPTAQVNDPTDQVVCNGFPTSLVTFTSNNTGGTTTYSWVNDTPSIGLAANGLGDIPGFTGMNPGVTPVTATITVTPHFTNGSVTCDGPTQSFTLTVNPTAQVNTPANQAVCHNKPTAAVNFITNNTGGTTSFTWVNDTPSIGLAANGAGDIPGFTGMNPGATPVIATITVTPHFTNGSVTCDGPARSFTITVNPLPVPHIFGPGSVCSGTTGVVYNAEPGNAAYTWTITSGGTFTPGPAAHEITVSWNIIGPQTLTVNFTDPNGCTAESPTSRIISVQTLPVPTLTGDQHVCAGNTKTYRTDRGATSYVWSIPVAAGPFTGGTASDSTLTMTWNNPGTYTITVNYTVGSTGCTAATPTPLQVIVNPNPTPVIQGPTTPICGYSSQVYFTAGSGNTYQWTATGGVIQPPANAPSVTIAWGNTPPVAVDLTETIVYTGVSCSTTAPAFPVSFKPWPVTPGTITGPESVCQSSIYTYSIAPIANAITHDWSYSGTGVTILNNGSPTVNLVFSSTATGGQLTVTGHNDCGDGPTSVPMIIETHPLPVVSYTLCHDVITTKNAKPFMLTGGNPSGPSGTYHLNFPSNPALAGDLFNPGDGAVNTGANTIYYIYTTVHNCPDTAVQTITVLPSNAGYICASSLLTDPRDPSVSYRTFPIGTQCWMAENLRFGTTVTSPSQSQPKAQTDNCISEKYCNPSDNAACSNYGGLYQWDELTGYGRSQYPYQGLCPPGWHIPTSAEWTAMIDQVAQMSPGVGLAGSFLQNPGGFEAKVKGMYYLNNLWAFSSGEPLATMFWTSTGINDKSVSRGLNTSTLSVSYYESSKASAFPVRCVKD